MGMAEYIEKWSVVNRLIDIENEFQQYKPFHGFEHAMYRKICEAEIAIGKTQAAEGGEWFGCWLFNAIRDVPEDAPTPDDFCSKGERNDHDDGHTM